MSMMDFLNNEQAKEALEDSYRYREELTKELEKINIIIFILRYFLETGEAIDLRAFGYEPEEVEDDE
jgi:hypothetical protein